MEDTAVYKSVLALVQALFVHMRKSSILLIY